MAPQGYKKKQRAAEGKRTTAWEERAPSHTGFRESVDIILREKKKGCTSVKKRGRGVASKSKQGGGTRGVQKQPNQRRCAHM